MFLAARPYVEMGLVDDFSYVKTAWTFAHTGRLVYNGWATAMLGWQIPLAAPFVRIFGDTYFACRLPVTILLLLSVVLTHRVLARAGLTRERAAFGTLLAGASPLTLPMAATFMTDVAGLFVIVLCLYCAMRAVRAGSHSAVLGWLVAGFVVGAIGGTARQIAWMAALVMMPSSAWLVRRTRGAVAVSAVMWIVSLAVMLGSLHWFGQQPFHVPEPLKQGPLHPKVIRELWGTMTAAALCLAMLMLPALSESLGAAVKRFSVKKWAGIAVVSLVTTFACKWITTHLVERGLFPWTGDIVERLDIFTAPSAWMLGGTPSTWSHGARLLGSVVVLFVTCTFSVAILRADLAPREAQTDERVLSWHELAFLLAPFCCAYVALLCPRGMWQQVLDRYLLPLLVLAALVLLRLGQQRFGARLGALPWALLLVVSLWTVAGLHDWIEAHRARLEAVARLHAAGVPDSALQAGYEYDGITQIDLAGAVADPRVKYPAGFQIEPRYPAGLPAACKTLYQEHTPALDPHYFLAYDDRPCLVPSRFGDVSYRRWLPPFTASVHIRRLAY